MDIKSTLKSYQQGSLASKTLVHVCKSNRVIVVVTFKSQNGYRLKLG